MCLLMGGALIVGDGSTTADSNGSDTDMRFVGLF